MVGQSLGGQGRGLAERSRMDDCPGVIRAAATHSQACFHLFTCLAKQLKLVNTDCGSQAQSKAWWQNQTVAMEARFYLRERKCCYEVKLALHM